MSILINGMEMPPDGRYTLCITHDSNGGVHWVIQNQDTLEFLKHGAVTEISEPHGRLGDLDAIEKQIDYMANLDWNKQVGASGGMLAALEVVEDAPTIIPAEEGET